MVALPRLCSVNAVQFKLALMSNNHGAVRKIQHFLAGALLLFPTAALANFFWPPALYYYGVTVWWAVPAGLAAEYVILYPFLRLSPHRLLKVVILVNVASALVGFLVTWPMVFWEQGIEVLVHGKTLSILLIVALIFLVNVSVEYIVSSRWLGVSRQRVAVIGFVVANAASFVVLVAAGFTLLRI